MSAEESLHDVTIREQQLEAFILRSPEYLSGPTGKSSGR